MVDLEDVLTKLYKFKENMKEPIKFIERVEKLFVSWSTGVDMGCDQNTTMNDILNIINEVLLG